MVIGDDVVNVMNLFDKRLDSVDQLFELLDKVVAALWWGEGTEGKMAIESFRKVRSEHKKSVAQFHAELEKLRRESARVIFPEAMAALGVLGFVAPTMTNARRLIRAPDRRRKL